MRHRKIIILIVIWILLLGGIFIYSKTKKEKIEPLKPEIKEKESLDKYQYIDYMGYYDENDLKVEKIEFEGENTYDTYIKITGLKDKNLEEKINKELYDLANSLRTEDYDFVHSSVTYNASNILSIRIVGNKNTTNKYIYRNIDLTTGNEIKIGDIVNIKNIIKPVADAYYDAAAYAINAEKKYAENSIKQYNSCIENNNGNCENIIGQQTIDELNQDIIKYDRYMIELEDDTLKYARNFDMNQDFYITSAGIIIENAKFRDINRMEPIRILINDNPRLYNFYYKYNTDESIFDGSHTGKKNLMYSDYGRYRESNPPSTEILDYALIYKDFFYEDEENIVNDASFKNYLESLDKNKFYYIDSFSIYNEQINIRQCTMTKDIYTNEFKKDLADETIKPHHSQGVYNIKSKNVSCEYLYLFVKNSNTYTLDTENGKKIYIRNNPEKANEINTYVETKIEELKKDGTAYMRIDSITESQITITITYYRNNSNYREEIVKTFDL